ncbi:hypothetical protein QJS10_CPB12g00661 [Acorus calamus]|uniref:Reverse transcriptase domain-containing protein n=1 Tax=Acorus calamus TaxID=4465 RepID=A0AAV9DME9_ACOCL|nr:hypothetical protein QJS10_CPB12g00661 [Acorus calamus]
MEAWSIQVEGSSLFRFVRKLNNVKRVLKHWKSNVYGPLQNQLFISRQNLMRIQGLLDGSPNDLAFIEEKSIRQNYEEYLQQEESFIRQKSRQQWLALGDKNSKDTLAEVPSLQFQNRVSHVENEMLCGPVSLEELRMTVFSFKPLSSPGPDGFSAQFYQLFWTLIKEDLHNAVKQFFRSGHILKQINHSFIALIPKSLSADTLDGYRPISLCNTLYKIITKILAQRLQKVLPTLISLHQSAFIKGRNIHHNVLLARELVKYLTHAGRSRACIKIDLRKAFDSVRWSYLHQVLKGFHFSDKWIMLCWECISTATFSILLNGSPAGIVHGVQLAKDLGVRRLWIESDSMTALAWLNGRENKD